MPNVATTSRRSDFDESLVEILWRNTTITVFLAAGATAFLLFLQLALGSMTPGLTIVRAVGLVVWAALLATFWADRRSASAVLVYAFLTFVCAIVSASATIALAGEVRAEYFGVLYALLLVPPLVVPARPAVLIALEACLLAPGFVMAVYVSDSATGIVMRSMLLLSVAVFAIALGRTRYIARRREFEALRELQAANEQLRETQAQLIQTEKLSALGTLSACIAHELSQPLTLLLGYTNVLAARLGRDAQTADVAASHLKQLEIMRRAAQRMSSLIDHLRGYARRSERARSTSLNAAVRGALLFVRGDLRRAGATLELELSEQIPTVHADPTELEQVVLNLLTNARDAVKGRPDAKVVIRTRRELHESILEVEDNGVGISDAVRDHLFELFVTTKPAGEGTGLGLWVAHGIVRNLGGTIEILPVKLGAAFRVRLPSTDSTPGEDSPTEPTPRDLFDSQPGLRND
jgi:signal transduction histidine kinase